MSLENFPSFLLNFSECELNGAEKHFYKFKSFRLDVGERQLFNETEAVALTPKAFDVLVALVERRGHLVEKDELLKLIWADSFVEEANIPRIVHKLRKTLGEDSNGNKFIETVPTKGYRFVAEVDEEIAPSAETDSIKPNLIPRTTQKNSKPFLLAGFAVLLAAALVSFFLLVWNSRSTSGSGNQMIIAVLPFNPVSEDNRDEANDLGFAMLLINQLNQSKNLKVRGFSTIKHYTDSKQDSVAIGKKLKADYVLESNYLVKGGRLLITSELHNVSSGTVEEAFSYEAAVADRFAAGDVIVSKISKDLLAKLNLAPVNFTARRGTANEEAFQLYMHGINLTDKRRREDAEKAVTDFENAVMLDPNFAEGYAGLAYAHTTVKVNGGDAQFHCEKALEMSQKALSLDANLADAYSILGMNQHSCQWTQTAAEESLRKAIELDPNSAPAHRFYGVFLTNIGRGEESIRELKTAFDLDPTSLFTQKQIGRALFYASRYDAAIAQIKQTRELDETDVEQAGYISVSYEMKGDYENALEWFLIIEKAEKPQIEAWKKIFAEAGWQGVLRRRLELAEQKADGKNFGEIASLAARLGEKEKALEYLAKEMPLERLFAAQITVDPTFDSLRSDARFAEVIKSWWKI